MRIREAKILLDADEGSGAYYLAGYAVECALKACIAAKFKEHEFPDKNFVMQIYSHDLENLLRHAGLENDPGLDPKSNSKLRDYWSIVKDWDETKRYEETTRKDAEALYSAIADQSEGVLQWLKKRW